MPSSLRLTATATAGASSSSFCAGHGGTSVVYKCRERRSGIVRACKIIDRRVVEKEHNGAMEQLQVRYECAVCVFDSVKHGSNGRGCLCWRCDAVVLMGSRCCCVQVEIQVLQSLRHPNIIHIEDVYLSGSKICMVCKETPFVRHLVTEKVTGVCVRARAGDRVHGRR